jgi:hypothetical protein
MDNALGIPSTSYWMSTDDKMQKVTVDEVINLKLPKMPDRILFE